MREEDLFDAYRHMREDWDSAEARVHEQYRLNGCEPCLVPGCLTLIAAWAGRSICRFHVRKLKALTFEERRRLLLSNPSVED